MPSQLIELNRETRLLVLDRSTTVAPLGLRFHDTMTGDLVGDGLSVWAYPLGQAVARRRAISNRKGVYVLHDAPGLRDLENGEGDNDYWQNLPPKKDFVIEVSDDQRRFQPFQFVEGLPVKGVYKWNGSVIGSPLSAKASIPLYSSPVRPVPAGVAVVRAEVWDPTRDGNGAPAAWAAIELYDDLMLVARGIADAEGRIALLFPYPPPRSFAPGSPLGSPLGSPPVATGPPLTEQVWILRARAIYAPPLSSPPNSSGTQATLPDLRYTLSQPEANIWADAARTELLQEVAVQFGHEQVLKSRPSSMSPPDQTRASVLFITPAASPP